MRLTSAAAATPVAPRAEVSKSAVEPKSLTPLKTAEFKPLPGQLRDEFRCGIGPGGCFPAPQHPSIPFPLPFPRPGDADGRTQGRQLHDIAEGVRNGSITSQEAERLLQQQESISKATDKAMADGKLTTAEKLQLRAMQAQADLSIYQAGHNGQRDLGARWDSGAQTQAAQIDRIANGRANGNITANEATGLLDQQEQIADVRGDFGGWLGDMVTNFMQHVADGNISFHNLKGDQDKWGPYPVPTLPLPSRPLPPGLNQPLNTRPALELFRGTIAG
ncbi:hypothetical protein [Hyalangium minutum]|uniref:Uncharacterized protein n=1 Tax=Hyalangium minutum TaxID=394096 RepID=A0A085VZE6_9BACT|nr:hypothetical protein [Hyalangium minutum]KFE60809.1 hypothetical protein DB31_4722 [Hyalangium minutum]